MNAIVMVLIVLFMASCDKSSQESLLYGDFITDEIAAKIINQHCNNMLDYDGDGVPNRLDSDCIINHKIRSNKDDNLTVINQAPEFDLISNTPPLAAAEASNHSIPIVYGPPGILGPPGIPGPSGEDGMDGVDGDVGPAGAPGMTGATGPSGPAGADGINGMDGADGVDGIDGISCWDTNGNSMCDPSEDSNDDNECNTLDCQGAQGAQGPSGPAGADGMNGADGADGIDGISCWDLNGNGLCDINDPADDEDEDTDNDGDCDANDCCDCPRHSTDPNGECGNGIQEVYPQDLATCSELIYVSAHTGPMSSSTLYYLDHLTGDETAIGDILGVNNLVRVTAIDFSPSGQLYGVGSIGNQWNLVTINCTDAQATLVGPLGLSASMGRAITDINFGPQGRLWAYYKTPDNISADELGLINIATGEYTTVGVTGIDEIGNGMASARFLEDNLYQAGFFSLNILNKVNGAGSFVAPISVIFDQNNSPRITSMDTDFFTNYTYVLLNNTPLGDGGVGDRYLAIINRVSGEVHMLTDPPVNTANGASGLAINRVYESCDTGGYDPQNTLPLPAGTLCNDDCIILETDCSDGEDNDYDGLIDCEDSDCDFQECSDGEQCTGSGSCMGEICVSGPDLNDGTPCDDGNECTDSDECTSGMCSGTIISPAPCDDGNPCTDEACDMSGTCVSTPNDTNLCTDNNICTDDECVSGVCQSTNNTNSCDDGDSCTISDICNNGICSGVAPGVEMCFNQMDDDCDDLIDGNDPDCQFVAFATSTFYQGNFGSAVAADALCNTQALAGSLSGTFVAITSDSNSTAFNRVTSNGPWYLVGQVGSILGKVADDKADLFDGSIDTALNVDEFGNDLIGNCSGGSDDDDGGSCSPDLIQVWTGSTASGIHEGSSCTNWTSASSNVNGRRGDLTQTDNDWITDADDNCDELKRLYCFQIAP